jgi:hypothetical protein
VVKLIAFAMVYLTLVGLFSMALFGNKVLSSSPSKIGVKNRVHFDFMKVDPPGNYFTIQQNFFIRGSKATRWVQNVYRVYYTGTPGVDQQVFVNQMAQLWTVSTHPDSLSFLDSHKEDNIGCPPIDLELNSYIGADNWLCLSGLQLNGDWFDVSAKVGDGAFIVETETDQNIQDACEKPSMNTAPEIVLVGDWGGKAIAWAQGTLGSVKAFDAFELVSSAPQWVEDTGATVLSYDTQQTAETSNNMEWKSDDNFQYKSGSSHSGIAYYYLPPPPPPLNNQTGVGGIVVPVDKFGLLAPYIGLTSTILVISVATTICAKRVKHRKENR